LNLPFVSVIIPLYNEEKYIRNCLESVLNQTYPEQCIEVILISDNSTDGTDEIIQNYSHKYDLIKVFKNEFRKGITGAINTGIIKSSGEYIVRLDAHTTIPENYIYVIINYFLRDKNISIVSGLINPVSSSYTGDAISFCLSSAFAIGDARLYHYKKNIYANRGYLGSFKKEELIKLGSYDINLSGADDFDVFYRYRKAGKKILVTPDIKVKYFCRNNLLLLFRQYFYYGVTKVCLFKKYKKVLSIKAIIPALFLLLFILLLFSSIFVYGHEILFLSLTFFYVLVNLYFSLKISINKGMKYLFILPLVFLTFHISHALGFLYGFFFMSYGNAYK
jgi:glycosyltransferase involved in cell wall biosynthesis